MQTITFGRVLAGLLSFGLAVAVAQPMLGVYPIGPGGPGVDSFATVHEAATALSGRGLGGNVDFPISPGTYAGPVLVHAVANSRSFSTTFRSAQQPATIDAGGAPCAFAVESTDNLTLQRLRFTGARDSGSAAVRFSDSRRCHVRAGRVGDSCDVGILAVRCDSLRLDSVLIEDALAGTNSRGVEFRDCWFTSVYRCSMPEAVGTGMLISGGGNTSVYMMTVMNPLVCGIRVENSVRDSFSRCFTRGAPEFGIHATRATGLHLDSITTTGAAAVAAFFDECGSLKYLIPMIVTDAPRAFWLSRSEDCVVRLLSIMGQPAVGMFFDRSPRCVVESTQVMGVQSDTAFGVLVDSSPGCTFIFTQMVGSFRRGIVVRRSDRVRFHHARVRGTVSEAAMSLENSSGVRIQACSLNTASGTTGAAAVSISGDCVDDTLMSMTILAEARYGIHAQGSGVRNTVVANNYLSGWTGNGIFLDGAESPRLFYNTIVSREETGVSGVRLRNVTGAEAKDNIVWNKGFDSSACYRIEGQFPFAAGASDHNDLYVSGAGGSTGRVNDTLYFGLGDWRGHGSSPDGHSIARNPLFADSGDFHITVGSPCRDSGVPIAGVTIDHDGDERDSIAPDIGADERGAGWVTETLAAVVGPRLVAAGNPSTGCTRIRYALPVATAVTLRVHDIIGRTVRAYPQGRRTVGAHEVELDLRGLASGVYLLELRAEDYRETLKIVRQ